METNEPEIYHCPHCGAEIPNVEKKLFLHKTFCKGDYSNFSDGNLLQKSTMANIFELVDIDLTDFPRGIITRRHKDDRRMVTFTPDKIYWPVLGLNILTFYVFFEQGIPLYLKLIAIAVSVVTLVFFICNLIYNRFAKWELILKDGKGSFFSGIGKRGRTFTFEYNANSTVAAVTDDDLGRKILLNVRFVPFIFANIPLFILSSLAGQVLENRYVAKEGITVTTDGIQYNFAANLPRSDAVKYMAAVILHEIGKTD